MGLAARRIVRLSEGGASDAGPAFLDLSSYSSELVCAVIKQQQVAAAAAAVPVTMLMNLNQY